MGFTAQSTNIEAFYEKKQLPNRGEVKEANELLVRATLMLQHNIAPWFLVS
jgi:hypothetical protein